MPQCNHTFLQTLFLCSLKRSHLMASINQHEIRCKAAVTKPTKPRKNISINIAIPSFSYQYFFFIQRIISFYALYWNTCILQYACNNAPVARIFVRTKASQRGYTYQMNKTCKTIFFKKKYYTFYSSVRFNILKPPQPKQNQEIQPLYAFTPSFFLLVNSYFASQIMSSPD